jgi:hypothetical protein
MSSFSSDLKLELMVTGQNAGTWGDKTNTNLNLIQQAIAGFEQVTLSSGGTLALVMSDATLSNARNMVIKFATASIAASTVCTIPDSIEKYYIFDCTGLTNPSNLTIKTASGTGFSPDRAAIFAAYSDGTNLKEISLDTLGGTVAAAQIATDAVTTAKILQSNVTQTKMATNSVGTAQILQSNVTQTKLATNAVGTAQILQSNVTQTKLAANSVGPSQLQSTAVTAGTYTTANITVDEDGRLTAASTGSAGSPLFQVTLASQGPASGNFTANPNTSIITAYAGGAGGGRGTTNSGAARDGGDGAAGFFFFPISQPFGPHPFSVGGVGSSGNQNGQSGQTGGATSLSPSPISAPGGSGGSSGSGAQNSVTPGPAAIDMSRNGFFSYGNGTPSEGLNQQGFLVLYENILD